MKLIMTEEEEETTLSFPSVGHSWGWRTMVMDPVIDGSSDPSSDGSTLVAFSHQDDFCKEMG